MRCTEAKRRKPLQIAFIDPSLEAWEILATGVKKGIEVFILDPQRDAVEQITATIAKRSPVEAVHIICHGSPGALHLGKTAINARDLDRYAPLLQSWQAIEYADSYPPNPPLKGGLRELPPFQRGVGGIQPQFCEPPFPRELGGIQPQFCEPAFPRGVGGIQPQFCEPAFPRGVGGINLYGCQVAAGEIGRTFVEKLHQLTGANIAASSSPVGNWQLGGNWELETIAGKKLASETAFSATAMAAYPAVLSPSFGTGTAFGTGDGPRSVTVGDLNGDGNPDLAVANSSSDSVSVLLGDGSGNFGSGRVFGAGTQPISVALGDFNGDVRPDLAVANPNSASVSVLLADNSGGFGTQTTFGTAFGPISIVAEDFNGDGTPDLAVANLLSDSVSVLLADGSGSFGSRTNFGVGADPLSVAVGDFNGDRNPDLAVANSSNASVSVLLGNGNGGFGTQTTFGTGDRPLSIALADFNGDRILDLAVGNYLSDSVSVLLGNGNGGFGSQTTFGAGNDPVSVAARDFDGDRIPDLAVANFSDNSISVLLGNGSGSFGTQTTFGAGAGPVFLAAREFNGDAKPDFVVVSQSNNSVSVLLNTAPIVPIVPTVSIAPGATPAETGPTNGNFEITLNQPAPPGGLTVNFNVTGSTATNPADYSLIAGPNITRLTSTTFTIAAGATSATLNVLPIDDNQIEGRETVNLNLAIGSDYIISTTNNTAALTITENDFLGVSEIDVRDGTTDILDGTTTALNFGSTSIGTPIRRTFTIANDGREDLSLRNLSLPSGFSLVGSLPASIAPGNSDSLEIQFNASAFGIFSGDISFNNNDADENPFNFAISATVIAPEIEVNDNGTNIADGSTAAIDFGSTLIGTPISNTFTIQNTGTADIIISNLTVPAGFSIVGSPPATIPAGSSSSLGIQLNASAVGSFSGTISFENNDADENPFNFTIGGTVAASAADLNSGGDFRIEDCSIPPITEPPVTFNNVIINQQGNEADELLIGLAGDDGVIGNGGNDTIFGQSGADTLIGGTGTTGSVGGNGDRDLLYGNQGNDFLQGSEGRDTLYSGQGNDIARGGKDRDLIYGDVGDDTLMGDLDRDTLFGGTSNPRIPDFGGRDLLFGGAGEDLIFGNRGSDTLSGGDDDDTLWGGQENDLIYGDAGNDLLFGDKGNDILCGGDGSDTLFGGTGSTGIGSGVDRDILCGGAGEDLLLGNEGSDQLDGGSGNDTLRGGQDSDTIFGGDGADSIWGDLGNDSLAGGAGSDAFFLQPGAGSDVIVDFVSGTDIIRLAGGLTFGQLAITQNATNTVIQIQSSGENLATAIGAISLSESDFVVFG